MPGKFVAIARENIALRHFRPISSASIRKPSVRLAETVPKWLNQRL
jgi:hypothetical protein